MEDSKGNKFTLHWVPLSGVGAFPFNRTLWKPFMQGEWWELPRQQVGLVLVKDLAERNTGSKPCRLAPMTDLLTDL